MSKITVDPFASINPMIITSGSAIDASDWSLSKLREYQRIIESDRREAE